MRVFDQSDTSQLTEREIVTVGLTKVSQSAQGCHHRLEAQS